MRAIRRISLFAGPCAGKSTISAWLFAKLKMAGYEVEHVAEFVKAWVFIGRNPTSWDQIYISAKQLHKEDIVLRNGKSIVITESPVALSSCYAKKYKVPCHEEIARIADAFERKHPSLNIFIDRKGMQYKTQGRFQGYKAALEMDTFIKKSLARRGIRFETVGYDELDKMYEIVVKRLGKP